MTYVPPEFTSPTQPVCTPILLRVESILMATFPLARFHPSLRAEPACSTTRDALVCACVAALSARCLTSGLKLTRRPRHPRLHGVGTSLVYLHIAVCPPPCRRPLLTRLRPFYPTSPPLFYYAADPVPPCSSTPTSTRATSPYCLLSAPILPLWACLDTRPPNNALLYTKPRVTLYLGCRTLDARRSSSASFKVLAVFSISPQATMSQCRFLNEYAGCSVYHETGRVSPEKSPPPIAMSALLTRLARPPSAGGFTTWQFRPIHASNGFPCTGLWLYPIAPRRDALFSALPRFRRHRRSQSLRSESDSTPLVRRGRIVGPYSPFLPLQYAFAAMYSVCPEIWPDLEPHPTALGGMQLASTSPSAALQSRLLGLATLCGIEHTPLSESRSSVCPACVGPTV
ncbi:hypothetical protein B0H19DRAFT_1241025 [Mycena capillaripes]|nr:hypothetical protein B0H19DRAFT_1241025 [Mycena capillaripes]